MASGQAGFIDSVGQLRSLPTTYYPYNYYYYGYNYGGFAAMFFIVVFVSSFLLCLCVLPEPYPSNSKYIEVTTPLASHREEEENAYQPPVIAQKEVPLTKGE